MQLQPSPTNAPAGQEPRGGGVEHELEHLPGLVANLQPPPVVVHGNDGAALVAAAEVRDARLRADMWQWS
jgi:hypothetical protein